MVRLKFSKVNIKIWLPAQNFQKIGKLYIFLFHGAFKVFQG